MRCIPLAESLFIETGVVWLRSESTRNDENGSVVQNLDQCGFALGWAKSSFDRGSHHSQMLEKT